MKIKKLILKQNVDLPLFLNFISYNKYKKANFEKAKKYYVLNDELNCRNYFIANERPISLLIDLSYIE
jgi:hypothetical protein